MATDKELKAAAKELNEVLGIEPPINLKAKPEDLLKSLKTAIKLVTEDDDISEETQQVIDELKASAKKGKEPAPAPKKKVVIEEPEDEDEDPEEEDPEEEDPEEEEEEEKPKGKKGKDKPEEKKKGGKDKPEEKKKGNPNIGKVGAPESQTGVIRSLIKTPKMTREKLIKAYMEKFSVTEKQAEARMKLYESAYGPMGAKDKHL